MSEFSATNLIVPNSVKARLAQKGLKVGFANSLVIPQRNLFGKIVGIKCRKLEAEADRSEKYEQISLYRMTIARTLSS